MAAFRDVTIGLALFVWFGLTQAAPLPPVVQFFQKPIVHAASLAPDGSALAFLQRSPGARTRLVVLDLTTMAPTVAATFASDDVAQFRWVNAQRLVFQLDTVLTGPGRIDSGAGLFAVNRDGSAFRQLVETRPSNFKSGNAGKKLLPWNTFLSDTIGSHDGDEVFVVNPEEMHLKKIDYINLQRLNTVTGKLTDVDAPLHTFSWLVDQGGQLRVAYTREGKDETIRYRDDSGAWITLDQSETFSDKGKARPTYIDPAGRMYAIAGYNDKASLFTYDPATKALGAKPLMHSADFDIAPQFVAGRSKLLGIRYTIDAEVTAWLDKGMQEVQAKVDALLPATTNRISVAEQDQSGFVLVESFSDVRPTSTALYNVKTGKLLKVGDALAPFDESQLGRMDLVRIKARDGLMVPAWVTMPPGAANKNLPMVVLLHGGPWVRGNSWHFDAEVQFLASRGYVVLQPEFRGSTGYGERHFKAGWKQWGLAMQDDVADSTRWAIAQGIADPKRICVAGASYGGYATLMGLVNDPGLFRCGVNWVGVTDIDLMYDVAWSDFTDEFKRWGMPRMVGEQKADAAQLKATSPVRQAARITQPLLMAYGAYDVRVPMVHGEKLRDAVKAHNQQVEWVSYDEGHGWRKEATQIDFWTRVEAFLDKQIGSGK